MRSGGELQVVLYMDLACVRCAALWQGLASLPVTVCLRHFPVPTLHPRAQALHQAAEAAGLQGAFWPVVDRLFADRGRTDDPHLWSTAEDLGLDLERFESDRRSAKVEQRVSRDFRSGLKAGVTGTPAAFVDGRAIEAPLHRTLRELASR